MMDIRSREDLEKIISLFYNRLVQDKSLYPFFKEIVEQGTLESHLKVIVDFWEDILFQTYKYHNNPMKIHTDFHKKIAFKKEHFKLWLSHLHTTIDAHYEGAKSNMMKTRATSIAMVMQTKMDLYNN